MVKADCRNALFKFPVLANWGPGIVLLAALFMPQITGCDGLPVRPVDQFLSKVEQQPLSALMGCWQHFYGLFVVVLFAGVVVADRSRSDRNLAYGVIGFWVGLIVVAVFGTVIDPEPNTVESCLILLPFVVFPSWWCYAASRRRDWISAWARLATSIAVLGMMWTYLIYVFNRGARYGIFVTYGSLLLLAIVPWWLRTRWRKVLISASEPATPIRFRIWHLLVASTLFALLHTYYRYVVPMFDE